MNYRYIESKASPPPFVFKFGDVWPTLEPLSAAVLGTNVLWVQGSYSNYSSN